MKGAVISAEGIGVERVLDKLAQAGLEVRRARKIAKNKIRFAVDGKDVEKVFAILRGSCYNISEVRPFGPWKALKFCAARAGLLLGFPLFLGLVLFFEGRVLSVEVVGSGAYYRAEVFDVLARGGVKRFSPFPKQAASMRAEILSLPRVSYCSFSCEGGVLTVEVEVSDDASAAREEPLLCPVSGKIEEIFVLRGTPMKRAGDEVQAGELLVDCHAAYGEKTVPVIVMARAVILTNVSREYSGTEEEARAQAMIDFGREAELHGEKTERGWLFSGHARTEISLNL